MALEDVKAITDGANIMASMMNAGLDRESAEQEVVNQLRLAQRQKYAERNLREGNRAAAIEFLDQDEREFQQKGQEQSLDDYIDGDGVYREVIKKDDGEVVAIRYPQEDSQSYTTDERERFGVNAESDDPFERDPDFDKQNGGWVQKNGKLYWREDNKLYADPKFIPRQKRGPDYAKASMRQLQIAAEPGFNDRQRELREKALTEGQKTRRAEALDGSPQETMSILRSIVDNEKEAREIAEKPATAATVIGDKNLSRIQRIKSIGAAGGKGISKTAQAEVVPYLNQEDFEQAVRYVGPNGETVGYGRADVGFLGDDERAFAEEAQMAGAKLSRNQEWAANNLRLQNQGQTTVSDNIRPISINGELAMLADRLNAVGYGNMVVGGMRSTNDVDQAVANFITRTKQQGDQLYSFNTETGKTTTALNPGMAEVLQKLRYTKSETQNLANTLYTLGIAEAGGSQRRPMREDIIQDAGRDLDGGDAPLQRVANEKIGRGKKAKSVRGELAKLSSPDAQMPFIGGVEGEKLERARFLSAKASNMTPQERVDAYGEEKGGIANEVERREQEGRKAREERFRPKEDKFAAQQRALDSRFQSEGRRAERDFEDKEIGELVRLMKYGASQGTTESPAGRKLEVPSDSAFNRDARFQRIQEAQTPTTIAPQPGDMTGNQPTPANDAGRGGWMGGGNGGKIVSPWDKPEEPEEPKYKRMGYMSQPAGASRGTRDRREVIDRLQRENVRKRFGVGAAGAGAAAGLAALISGERKEREEEAYQ